MEMQYKLETGKMATMANLYIPVSQAISPTDDPQIQRTRKKLMRFFSVSINFSIGVVIFIICDLYDLVPEEIFRRGVQVGLNLLLIALYSFGLFAAYRYSVLGIRVFAWLYITKLVLIGFVCSLIFSLKIVHRTTVSAVRLIILGISCIASIIIFAAFAVKPAFKLAGLIAANKRSIIQQT